MSSEGQIQVLNEHERNDLIVKNLHLVNLVIKKYKFVEKNKYEDLVQEGRIGLIKAVESFDNSIGLSFKYYALYKIRYSIQDYLRKESILVHVPHNRLCQAYRLLKFKTNYIRNNKGTPPSLDEMRGFLSCDEKYLKDLLFIIEILNNKYDSIEEFRLTEKFKNQNKLFFEKILYAINSFPKKEREVLIKKYVEGRSFRSIGKNLNISHEMVRRIHNSSIKKLKKLYLK